MSKSQENIFAILYIIGALFVLVLAWLPIWMIIDHILYEDFFYYLKVAQNIAIGNGVTFDGEAKTNGFHPLWMIASIIIQTITTPWNAIHLLLTLAALLHIGQTYLVFQILKATCRQEIAHLVALFYLFNYRIIACNLCGLETPLVAFFILLVVYFLIKRFQSPQLFDTASAIKLGLLLGLSVLGRFDLLLFVGVIIGLIILDDSFSSQLKKRVFIATTVILSVFIVLLPWFLWSLQHSGTLLPNSHAALKVFAFKSFSLDFSLAENISLLIQKGFATAWWLTDTANLLGIWPIVLPSSYINLPALLIFLLLIALIYGLWITRTNKHFLLKSLLLIYAVGHLAYYSLFARAELRYLLPFNVIIILTMGMVINDLFQKFNVSWIRKMAIYAYVILLANSILAGTLAWQQHQGSTRTHQGHQNLYKMALWIRANTPETAIIGSWNAGIISYYSGRQVINLDGVMNDEVIAINKQKDLSSYIERRNISFLADNFSQIKKFMDRFSGQEQWYKGYVISKKIGQTAILQKKE